MGVVAVLGLVLSGCHGGSEMAGAKPSSSSKPSATVLVSDPTRASMSALGGGQLEVVGGCLGANGDVIIWPPGTQVVVNDPLKISIPHLGRYAIGDTVRLGGGYIGETSHHTTKPLKIGGVDVPESCLEYDIFLAGPEM